MQHTMRTLHGLPSQSEAFLDAAMSIVAGNCTVTTGMGKAGHIAQKVSSTLCSFGIKSCYLDPAAASHGDVGIVGPGDVVLAFSTSGKTREVIETVQLAQELGASTTIAITSHPDGEIRQYSQIVLDMGILKEAGHLNIAPTTSTTVMMVMADFLVSIAAEIKGATMADYALRHHSGYLGKKSREIIQQQR